MDGELILIRGGPEREPWGGADWERFVETGPKDKSVIRRRRGEEDPQEGDRSIRIDFGRKGEGKSTVGRAQDFCGYIGEGSSNCLPIRVWEGILSGSIEPSGRSWGSRRFGGGGGGGSRGGRGRGVRGQRGNPLGRGLFPSFCRGGHNLGVG